MTNGGGGEVAAWVGVAAAAAMGVAAAAGGASDSSGGWNAARCGGWKLCSAGGKYSMPARVCRTRLQQRKRSGMLKDSVQQHMRSRSQGTFVHKMATRCWWRLAVRQRLATCTQNRRTPFRRARFEPSHRGTHGGRC